jgi:hypothetical protein
MTADMIGYRTIFTLLHLTCILPYSSIIELSFYKNACCTGHIRTQMSFHSSFVDEQISICKGFSVEMLFQNMADTVMSQVAKIQTTLYDLVATLNTEFSPDEDNAVIATVVHLLNTHRVTCTGALRGYRLVCIDRARPVQTPPKGYSCLFQFESYDAHCERPSHKAIP